MIVVGVGTCGEDLSLRLLAAGLDVVGVEAALVGGECAYWACLPSKRMIRMANLVAEARRADGRAGSTRVIPDWGLVASQIRSEVTGGWDDSTAARRYLDRGGRLVRGTARLTGPRTVTVGDESITARRGIVIATGSRPAVPPVPGLAETEVWTTHDVMRAETLPESLIVMGGGAVGCELGQVLARFGVEVTIVEAGNRLLASEEPEASAAIRVALEEEGVAVHTDCSARRVEQTEGTFSVDVGQERLTAAGLLAATGRRVELRGLGLETAGIDAEGPFLHVDERMRVREGVWGMGDVTGKGMLTHVALYQAAVVAGDILDEDPPPARYDAVPRAVFTDPEVGAVGLTEAQAEAAGIDVVTVVKRIPDTFRGWLHAVGNAGLVKLVVDRGAGVLVGATVVGPHAAELLGFLGLAVHARVPVAELRTMIYAFPTFYGGVGEALGAYGRGLTSVLDPTHDVSALLDSLLL